MVKNLKNKVFTGLRLNEEDRKILEDIARKYDITISDVVRIAIKEFLKNNEIKLKEEGSS
jgi:replication initiation and membrane attachment protein DnaB